MARIRKYRKGEPLDFEAACAAIFAGKYVFSSDKVTHPSWAISWPVHELASACRSGVIFEAIITDEWMEKNNERDR